MTKTCEECGSAFTGKRKSARFCSRSCATRNWCERNKARVSEQHREYYKSHIDEIKAKNALYRRRNRERLAESKRDYDARNSERRAEYARKYRSVNRERIALVKRRWRKANPDKSLRYRRAWRMRNPEWDSEYNASYRAMNLEKCRAATRRSMAKLKVRRRLAGKIEMATNRKAKR